MRFWVRFIVFAAALFWTALMFLAYRDLGLAFRGSLIGWLLCGVLWVLSRLNLGGLVRTAHPSKKPKMLNLRYAATIGAAIGIFALVGLTAPWMKKKENLSYAVTPVAAPAATEHKPQGKDQLKANGTDTEKAARWSVQVGAFRSKQDAIKVTTALKERGWEAYVTSADVNGVTFYRASVGRFRTRNAAERLLLKLKDREAFTKAFVASM